MKHKDYEGKTIVIVLESFMDRENNILDEVQCLSDKECKVDDEWIRNKTENVN